MDFLQSVKSAVDPGCAANMDSVPEVKLRDHMSSPFDTISFSTLCKQITQTQKSKADVEVKRVLAMDDTIKAVYDIRMMGEADATICKMLKERLKSKLEKYKKDYSDFVCSNLHFLMSWQCKKNCPILSGCKCYYGGD
jgi:hypothetical protein